MTCNICGSHNMIYKDSIILSNGAKYDVYVCRECGFMARIPK